MAPGLEDQRHLLSSAMLPTRVASRDCSMVLSSDWLNMGSSPGLLERCWSLCRFRLSGRHSTPAAGETEKEDGRHSSGHQGRVRNRRPRQGCTGRGVRLAEEIPSES